MPKPVLELQEKERPIGDRVIEFLSEDPQNAYTVDEIFAQVQGHGKNELIAFTEIMLVMMSAQNREKLLAPWMDALNLLEQSGRVRSFRDGNTVYYAWAVKP